MIKEKYAEFFFLIILFFIVVNQPVCVEFEYQLFTQKINLKDNHYKILDDFATLSGNFTDSGLDKDSDGQFDYLVLEIEVDVTVAGTYQVYVWGLKDSSGNIISVSDSNTTYLGVGLQTVQIYLAGQAIYGQGLDPTEIVDIYLYDDSGNKLGELDYQPLSQPYSYTDFGSDNTFSTTVPSSTGAITTSTDPSSSFTSEKTRSTNTTTITTSTDPSSSFSSEKTGLRSFFGLLFSLILIVLVIRHRRKSIP